MKTAPLALIVLLATSLLGQNRGTPARTPKDAAAIDLTGYWVSIVTEDWRFRMLTPPKGDYPDITPLNDAGKNSLIQLNQLTNEGFQVKDLFRTDKISAIQESDQ